MSDETVKLTPMLSELTSECITHAVGLLREFGSFDAFVMVTNLDGEVRPLPVPAEHLSGDDLFRFVGDVSTTIHAAAVVLALDEPRPSIAILLEQAGGAATAVVVEYRSRPADEPEAEMRFGAEGAVIRSFTHTVEIDEPAATGQPQRVWLMPAWQSGLGEVAVDFGKLIQHAATLLTSALPGKSGFPPFMLALTDGQLLVFGEPPGNPPHQMDPNNDVAMQEFRRAAAARAVEYRTVAFCYDGYLDDGRDVACFRCEHRDGSVREFGYEYRRVADGAVEFGELVSSPARGDATIWG